MLGWLGLNRASTHDAGTAVELFPVVGVRHQGVERVVAELRGEKFHQYIPATVGARSETSCQQTAPTSGSLNEEPSMARWRPT